MDTSETFEGEASTFVARARGGGRGGLDLSGMAASVEMSMDVTGGRAYSESSPTASEGTFGDGHQPPFKSLSDACHHLLARAGAAGLQVSDMVREIQTKGLVKLGGRTPSNTVYSRLSQDPRFVNVARGAYALATVVGGGGGGGGTAASTPSKFSAGTTTTTTTVGTASAFGGFFGTTTRGGVVGMHVPMTAGGPGGTWERPAALGSVGGAQGGGANFSFSAAAQADGRPPHVDEYDMGSVQGDDTPPGDGATTPMESEAVTADQLGSSSVFSLKPGDRGAKLAAGGKGTRGGSGRRQSCPGEAANNGNQAMSEAVDPPKEPGMEALEAELSAGLLMGLRSGGRRASVQ